MAVYAGPDFVDRGLIYCADAGNSRSFTLGTTPIRNSVSVTGITGNQGFIANGTIYSPRNGGVFSMDGTNDTIAVPYGIGWCPQGINGPTNMTLSLWFYYITGGNVLVKAFNSGNGKYNFGFSSGWMSIGAGQVFGFSSSEWGGFSSNIWQNFTFSVSSTQLKTYRNGVLTATRNHNITTAFTGALGNSWEQYVGIGGWPFGGDMNGFVGPLHFYNVVLTDSEIMQNFNSTRGRFNI